MRLDIVEAIHDHGKIGKRWFATLNRRDHKFHEWNGWTDEEWVATDLYFAPGRFYGKRKNINLATFNLLWADLDDNYNDERLQQFVPSYLWETSPDNLQAVWFLDDHYGSYDQWALVNQGLTYWLNADKGGWHGSKLLRIPDTLNWKRWNQQECLPPRGAVLLENYNRVYSPEQARQFAGEARNPVSPPEDSMPPVLDQEEADDVFISHWPDLSMSTQACLATPLGNVSDRSMHIIRAVMGLKNDGVPMIDAFHILSYRPYNKYSTRMHILWQLINEVYAR